MEDGYSFESFAGVIRVSRDTIYEWVKKHKEFSDAKKVGRALSLKYWETVGKDGLYNEIIKGDDGLTVTRSINATIWIFNMKNRFRWKDRNEVKTKITGSVDASPEVKELVECLRTLILAKSQTQ